MKIIPLILAVSIIAFTGCRGPGGPGERAGRAVDTAVYNVGEGVKRTGETIKEAAD